MKKTNVLLCLSMILCNVLLFSQTDSTSDKRSSTHSDEIKTIFNKNVCHGGYFGFTMNYSAIDGENALFLGGRGGWIINHSLTIGLAGYGFSSDFCLDGAVNNKYQMLAGGYGGLLIEPIIAPRFPVHLAFPIILGVGGIACSDSYWSSDDEWDYSVESSDAYLIVEPGAELDVNVLKHLRMSIGVTYRYAYNINIDGVDSDILNGLSTGISLKIGKF